jgi:hypothetical protein
MGEEIRGWKNLRNEEHEFYSSPNMFKMAGCSRDVYKRRMPSSGMFRRVVFIRTDISYELIALIIRVI